MNKYFRGISWWSENMKIAQFLVDERHKQVSE